MSRSRRRGAEPEPAHSQSARRAAAAARRDDRPRRGRRWLRITGIVLVLAAIGGLVAAAYLSPIMAVRNIDVTGNTTVPREEVLARADVAEGTPLLQVHTAAVAGRVAAIPAVESVRVDRHYPSGLAITVTERRPTALLDLGDGRLGVMDRIGVVYREFDNRDALKAGPAGKVFDALPTLSVPTPGPKDPTTRAALTVVGDLPDWLSRIVVSVSASSPADVKLQLTKNRTAVWGDDQRDADKAEALQHLLTLQGRTYNVSSPDYPSVS
ncbi:MAG: FtsQ-type POTRA domain-containing protein [Gordonia sp. (in: high G+C Gram-positive bacteria)]|uniref:cell division protein FtsQ/DivIB n=1 Tax=Gordonia sp. (in: high G+C Gram-positive bacteria) TaxID=84139 RepID=UPI0039E52DA9